MAKKVTATLENQDQEQPVTESVQEQPAVNTGSEQNPAKNKTKAGGPPSGFYIYIGPNIPRLIRNGDIYRGDKASALAKAREAIEKYPLVKTLIIPGDQLPTAHTKVKKSGNALHANYVKLVGQVRSGGKKE